jgi:uncharacterized membrane protein
VEDETGAFVVDSLVKPKGGAYAGDGVVNDTGKQQTVTLTARRGVTRTFFVRVQNDGAQTDSYSIVGTGSGGGFTTRYFEGQTNVTGEVVRGLRSTGEVAPGEDRTYRITVQPRKSAAIGDVRVTNIWAVSYRAKQEQGLNVRDLVRVRVKVTR